MTESFLTRLNNLLAEAAPDSASETRLRRLRGYSLALVEPVVEHVREGLLSPADAVRVMLAGAMFFALRAAGPAGEGYRKRGMGRLVREVFSGLGEGDS